VRDHADAALAAHQQQQDAQLVALNAGVSSQIAIANLNQRAHIDATASELAAYAASHTTDAGQAVYNAATAPANVYTDLRATALDAALQAKNRGRCALRGRLSRRGPCLRACKRERACGTQGARVAAVGGVGEPREDVGERVGAVPMVFSDSRVCSLHASLSTGSPLH
jgi:hypothetical protein